MSMKDGEGRAYFSVAGSDMSLAAYKLAVL